MFRNYLLTSIRNLMQNKIYSFINIVGLTVGIACAMLILSYIRHELSYNLQHENADRLYLVLSKRPTGTNTNSWDINTHPGIANLLQTNLPEIDVAFKTFARPVWVTHGERSYEIMICVTDTNFVDSFTYPAINGDTREILRRPNAAMITERFARQAFGDRDPIGEIISIDYKWGLTGDFIIQGILRDPPETSSPELAFDFITLNRPTKFQKYRWELPLGSNPNYKPFQTWVLLRNGVSPDQIQGKFQDILFRNMEPEIAKKNGLQLLSLEHLHLYLNKTLQTELAGYGDTNTIKILGVIGVVLLVIAAVNFINLTTARSLKRAREIGVRKTLGATRGHLIIQFLVESILMTFTALLLAFVLVELTVPILEGIIFVKFQANWTFFDVGLVAVFVGSLSGIYPALYLSSFQPIEALKTTPKLGSAERHIRRGLVIFQFALSAILIVAMLTVMRQMDFLQNKDVGFDKNHLLTLRLFQSENDPILTHSFISTLRETLTRHPNITHASASLYPIGFQKEVDYIDINLAHQQDAELRTGFLSVDEKFISTFGLRLIEGRDFRPDGGAEECIINKKAAQFLVQNNKESTANISSLVGQPLQFWGKDYTIAGIVSDFHHRPLYNPAEPLLLVHANPQYMYMTLRINPNGFNDTIDYMRDVLKQFVPDREFSYAFLDDTWRGFYRKDFILNIMLMIAVVLTIFIACLGLIGITVYTAQRRTKEIAIRKVLGASIPNIMLLLSMDFWKPIFFANLIAWPFAYYFLNSWLQNFAYRINLDIWSFLLGGVLTLLFASITVGYQTFKAAHINPSDALQNE